MDDQEHEPQPSLVERGLIPASVDIMPVRQDLGSNQVLWYVESTYHDGTSRLDGPYPRETALRCRDVLRQAYALEWQRDRSE